MPNGEITLLSSTLEVQRAFAMLELAVKDESGAIDKYNAWENYMLKADPRASKRLLNPRQVYEQIQQLKMEQEQIEHVKKLETAGRAPAGTSIRLGQPASGAFSGNNVTGGGGNLV